MRQPLVICLVLLICGAVVGAESPIPQDVVKIEKRRRDRLEWNRETLQGAYDKIGQKNPKWDEPARKALDLAARMFSEVVDPEVDFREVNKAARAAVAAGCDDPMVLYVYNRTMHGANFGGPEKVIARARESAKALGASGYPAYRRMVALKMAGLYTISIENPSESVRKDAERYFDEALALIEESVKNDERNEFWEAGWYDSLLELIGGYRKLDLAAPAAYKRVDDRLAKHPEAKVLRLLVRGSFWINYGWEARTNSFAANVPAGGFEQFTKRLEVARKALEEAWQIQPGTARAASSLLDIEKSIGGDRDTMELWFDRAMKANGDARNACWSKLDWLDPKWHGTVDEMIEFGRTCRDTKNWQAKITLLVADAHWRYVITQGNQEQVRYMSQPDVWSDIKGVYDEYLKHHPNDDAARSKYATSAYLGDHFPEAHAQYEALGDRLTSWPEFPVVPLEKLKQYRNYTAQIIASKKR